MSERNAPASHEPLQLAEAPPLFAGLVVLEHGESPAVAFATRMLGDLGAEVIKIEGPGGDRTRREGFVPEGSDASGIFAYTNAGKRTVVVDLESDGAAGRLLELIEAADILVDGHAPAQWEALGIDFDALPGRGRCRLAVSITPFGRFGERAEWAANHMTVHHTGGEAYAFPGGISWLIYPDAAPVRVPGRVAELDAGWSAGVAMLGWLSSERAPSVVELTIQEAAMGLSRQDIVKFPNDGFYDTRATRSTPVLGQVECKDGWMEIYPTEQAQWERLVKALDDPDWAHELGETPDDRIQHTGELNDLFAVWLLQRTKAEIYATLRDAEVPAGPVRTPREVIECAQMRYRGLFRPVNYGGELRDVPAHPYVITEAATGSRWRAGPRPEVPPAPAGIADDPRERPRGGASLGTPGVEPGRWLAGKRVIDLTWYQAGPYCNMILASLGAEVIKVESLARTDPFRRSRRLKSVMLEELKSDNWLNTGYRFNEVNLNKRGAQLDLKSDEGRELLKQLVAQADVVIESFRPGTVERLGIGFDTLREVNPNIVMLSISANGSGGPDGHLSGYAAIFGATSGMGALSGYDAGVPSEYRGPTDQRVGTAAAFATMVGLQARERSGGAVHIDFAASEVGTSLIGDQLLEWQARGCVDEPLGNHHPTHAPHNSYACLAQDGPGWVVLAAETDEQWARLAQHIGVRKLDPTWDLRARKAHEQDIDAVLAKWAQNRNRDELVRELQSLGIPSSPSMNAQDLYEDQHLRTRGMWTTALHQQMGELEVLSMPWIINGARLEMRAAPIVGQDNDYVHGELLGLPIERREELAGAVLR